MKKFEYITTFSVMPLWDFELKQKGEEGWELCEYVHIQTYENLL